MFNLFSYLSLPVITVKKTKADYKSLYDLFVTNDNERLSFQRKAISALFQGDIETYDSLTKGKNIQLHTYFIDALIDSFASHDLAACETILNILNSNQLKDVQKAEITNNSIFINLLKKQIKISRFSDSGSKVLEFFPELTTKHNRQKQCHNLSLKFVFNADFDCRIATGYVSSFAKEAKYLHSWVETIIDNQNVAIDLTRNLITDTGSYYYIQNITTPVYKIPQSLLLKERELFNNIARYSGPLSKLYLANRPQAIRIYEQQTQLNKAEEQIK